MARLPDAHALFKRFFLPHYPEEDLKRLKKPMVWGDIVTGPWERNLDPADISVFAPEFQAKVRAQMDRMVEAARRDWATYASIQGDPSFQWLDAFHAHWTTARIKKLIADSDPAEDLCDYAIICIELGAVLGRLLTNMTPGMAWVADMPYWETWLYHAPTGSRVSVYSWAVKRMSDTAFEDPLSEKVQAAAQGLNSGEFA